MKRLLITLLVILLILFVLNYVMAVIVSKSVETALYELSDDPSGDITLTSVNTRPWAATISIHDFTYTGFAYPTWFSAGRLDVKLKHYDLLKLAFSRPENALGHITRYNLNADTFSYQHDGYPFTLNATEAGWSQTGRLQDFFDAAVSGRFPEQGHRFLLDLKEPVIQPGRISSLPGFSGGDNHLHSGRILIDLEYTPDGQHITIHQAIIEDERNRAEYRGNAVLFAPEEENGTYRIEAELHLAATTPDFDIAVPGNAGQLNAQTMNATLLTTIHIADQHVSTDDYVFRFTAGNAVLSPSSSVKQQIEPMFRILGIPFQPLAISHIEGDAMMLNNRFEFSIREAETSFTNIRFHLATFLQEEDMAESPVTGGALELYEMQPQVVQLVRGLESFMRWQLQWDGNSVYVPVTGTLARPRLMGITER